MHTMIEIAEEDLKQLEQTDATGALSHEELVRKAIQNYLLPHTRKLSGEAFGIWRDLPEDGLAYQQRMRDEWNDRP